LAIWVLATGRKKIGRRRGGSAENGKLLIYKGLVVFWNDGRWLWANAMPKGPFPQDFLPLGSELI
jgi:hypothetical protein